MAPPLSLNRRIRRRTLAVMTSALLGTITQAPKRWVPGQLTHSVGAGTTSGEESEYRGERAGVGRQRGETRLGPPGTAAGAVPRVQEGRPPWTGHGGEEEVDRPSSVLTPH